jgi:predicted aconitase with swiveling domain
MRGTPLVAGRAAGPALASAEPLSFWGGYDFRTGEIIDLRHPLAGQHAAGRVLALPYARGSSTTTAVLLEAVRAGTAPAAILTTGPETFFALASIVAEEMYGRGFPVIMLDGESFGALQRDMLLRVDMDGTITIEHTPSVADRA